MHATTLLLHTALCHWPKGWWQPRNLQGSYSVLIPFCLWNLRIFASSPWVSFSSSFKWECNSHSFAQGLFDNWRRLMKTTTTKKAKQQFWSVLSSSSSLNMNGIFHWIPNWRSSSDEEVTGLPCNREMTWWKRMSCQQILKTDKGANPGSYRHGWGSLVPHFTNGENFAGSMKDTDSPVKPHHVLEYTRATSLLTCTSLCPRARALGRGDCVWGWKRTFCSVSIALSLPAIKQLVGLWWGAIYPHSLANHTPGSSSWSERGLFNEHIYTKVRQKAACDLGNPSQLVLLIRIFDI